MTFPERTVVLAAIGLIALQFGILYLFGQPLICECGYVSFWNGVVQSAGNSQHISDWYTFSHIIHGFAFYALLWYFFPKLSVPQRLLVALALEIGWELLENTPMVIDHYRQQALAQGYIGDSILNSVSDTLAMIAGFLLAWRFPVWIIVTVALALELFTGLMIRDGLMLNIVNLIHVFPSIEAWQMGA